jgi:hypothetical protein
MDAMQERIDEAAARVQVSREEQADLRAEIVRLALQGKSVKATAAKLKAAMTRHGELVRAQNDLIRQQLKEAFG